MSSPASPQPVLFIHGLWLHASSWQPWIDLFQDAGYAASAVAWPGEAATVAETRAHPEDVAGHGIEEVTRHVAATIEAMDRPPILIGHSFGGMIAEKLLGEGYGAAAVGIDAAQIKGVLPLPLSSLRATLPVFKNLANSHRAVSLTAEEFRYSFGNTLSPEESDALHERWTIPSPGKPLFEAAAANLSPHSPAAVHTENEDRGPLLLIMGGQDHTVPEVITKSTVKQYRHSSAVTDLLEFADRGHSLTIDGGWREVADACLGWLVEHGLGGSARQLSEAVPGE
ncbi:alpha/beta hydrolase [Petropleomorpha daqingensis]|uniref:Alpha-beta hydrolase superfamily lysophospholipase n=1 Tax=Petropleomorpha daqingensis TaxID=2026353 RepID=A0A853CEG3_9ACTN|nr:alpha/beta fold hydrolase [Petropleomorpha daqingensis]NYJ06395.1 alpha-beta hydrolase superfamily lysophospholipase [Petropleomorpha daqingensis]